MTEEPTAPWRTLLDAAVDAHEGRPQARYAQLATVRPDGRPANRTVVVRGLLDPGGRPIVTTDSRSAKFNQLAANPRAELCWWFPETREQFRLSGRVAIVGPDSGDDATRLRIWSELTEPSRRSFSWPAPGAPRAGPPDFHQDRPAPAAPPTCFVLLVLDPEEVEHLDLRPQPHGRARYARGPEGWLVEQVNP